MEEWDDECLSMNTCMICGNLSAETFPMPKPSEVCEREYICDRCEDIILSEWIPAHLNAERITPRHRVEGKISADEHFDRAGLLLLDFISEHATEMRPFISFLKEWLAAGKEAA